MRFPKVGKRPLSNPNGEFTPFAVMMELRFLWQLKACHLLPARVLYRARREEGCSGKRVKPWVLERLPKFYYPLSFKPCKGDTICNCSPRVRCKTGRQPLHGTESFKDEYRHFVRENGVPLDTRYVRYWPCPTGPADLLSMPSATQPLQTGLRRYRAFSAHTHPFKFPVPTWTSLCCFLGIRRGLRRSGFTYK